MRIRFFGMSAAPTALFLLAMTTFAACSNPDGTQPAPEIDAAQSLAEADAPPALADLPLDGYGAAPFGSDEETVRAAYAGALEATAAAAGSTCHYLLAVPKPVQGRGVAFMFEDGKFVRLDVDNLETTAPSGVRVGSAESELQLAFGAQLKRSPHKYDANAHLLEIADPSDASHKLIFEMDADGNVTRWRMGVTPQVDYVEGCG